jgi:hypothetical protein
MRARRLFTTVAVDPIKFRDYCLSDQHPRGRHKARVFRSQLGLTTNDVDLLRRALLDAAQAHRDDLIATEDDQYGRRFTLDFEMTTAGGRCDDPLWLDFANWPANATVRNLLRLGLSQSRSSETLSAIRLLDVVALTTDVPDKGLVRGQVGTVIEVLGPQVYEIEFSDDSGRTYAQLPLRGDQLLVLHYEPQQAA